MTLDQPLDRLFEDDPLLSVEEAARYLSISKTSVHKAIRDGLIPVVKVTSDRRVRRSDLNWLVQQKIEIIPA
jgi:excisionase family DNA binding protein